MICLYTHSSLCTVTIVFYTCIWIPYLQIKHALLFLIGAVSSRPAPDGRDDVVGCLPAAARYGDLGGGSGSRGEEMCSVCLEEFESEDVVCKLSKCGHVFHLACIERWVDQDQFTCPLCRSILLNIYSSHAKCI